MMKNQKKINYACIQGYSLHANRAMDAEDYFYSTV